LHSELSPGIDYCHSMLLSLFTSSPALKGFFKVPISYKVMHASALDLKLPEFLGL
jgi:hypothetical protein